jgi:uncharacterized protein (DUF58 family)
MILIFLALLFILKFNSPAVFLDYLIGLVLVLCAASVLYTLWVARSLHVQVDTGPDSVHEGEDISVTVRVSSPEFFGKLRACFSLHNLQRSKSSSEKRIITEHRTEFRFSGSETGTIELSVPYVEIYGVFGVFRIRRRDLFAARVNVYPNPGPSPDRHVRMVYIPGDGETHNAKGDDYTEIFELRPLQEGDSLRHVHRQLSAKYDEYIIKVGSDSRRKVYNYYIENGLDFPEISDRIAEMFTLLRSLDMEDGSLMAASYKGRFYAMVNMTQLYGLTDRIYADYLPEGEKTGRSA